MDLLKEQILSFTSLFLLKNMNIAEFVLLKVYSFIIIFLFQAYEKNSNLNKFYKVLSTNRDKDGKEFISTMEGKPQCYIYILDVFTENPYRKPLE